MKEIRGKLSENEFHKAIHRITNKYWKPQIKRQTIIIINNLDNKILNNQIIITDGKAELIQHVNNDTDQDLETNEEIRLNLPNNSFTILLVYKIISNLTLGNNQKSTIKIYKNYSWNIQHATIELKHHINLVNKYTFKIEADFSTIDVTEIVKKIKLTPNMSTNRDNISEKWDTDLNIDAQTLSEDELISLLDNAFLFD